MKTRNLIIMTLLGLSVSSFAQDPTTVTTPSVTQDVKQLGHDIATETKTTYDKTKPAVEEAANKVADAAKAAVDQSKVAADKTGAAAKQGYEDVKTQSQSVWDWIKSWW